MKITKATKTMRRAFWALSPEELEEHKKAKLAARLASKIG